MKLEQWIQLLIAVVILGAIGFLASNQFDIKAVLSSVSTKVEATNGRINRIADALPEVKVRIAWEETYNTMKGFVASTLPEKMLNSNYSSTVILYDPKGGILKRYKFLSGRDSKSHLKYLFAGKLKCIDPHAASFKDLAIHSAFLKDPFTMPNYIDPESSFVLRKADIQECDHFFRNLSYEEPQISGYKRLHNWKELSENLEDIMESFKTIEKSRKSNPNKANSADR